MNKISSVLISLVGAVTWRSMISQVNTGRVYMFKDSLYHMGPVGPVCLGSRDYKLRTSDCPENTLCANHFAHDICKDNGYANALFFGNFEEYKTFVGEMKRKKGFYHYSNRRKYVVPYLKNIHRKHGHSCIPNFTVGGGRRHKERPRGKRGPFAMWDLIDYQRVGGNCLKKYGSAFIHCGGYQKPRGAEWSEWSSFPETTCHCGEWIYSYRKCQSKTKGPNGYQRALPPYHCFRKELRGGNTTVHGFLKGILCQNCKPDVDYAYNEHYYEATGSDYYYYSSSEKFGFNDSTKRTKTSLTDPAIKHPRKKSESKEFCINTKIYNPFNLPSGRTKN